MLNMWGKDIFLIVRTYDPNIYSPMMIEAMRWAHHRTKLLKSNEKKWVGWNETIENGKRQCYRHRESINMSLSWLDIFSLLFVSCFFFFIQTSEYLLLLSQQYTWLLLLHWPKRKKTTTNTNFFKGKSCFNFYFVLLFCVAFFRLYTTR